MFEGILEGKIIKFSFDETNMMIKDYINKREKVIFNKKIATFLNQNWKIEKKENITYLFSEDENYRISFLVDSKNIIGDIRKKYFTSRWCAIGKIIDISILEGNLKELEDEKENKEKVESEELWDRPQKIETIDTILKKLNIPVEKYKKIFEENKINEENLFDLTDFDINQIIDKVGYRIALRKYIKNN
jgi:hypothetical protein